MAPLDLRIFLDRSFELLARDAPGAYSRVCDALGGVDLCVVDGGRRFAVRSHGGRLASGAVRGDEHVVIGVDQQTILALVDGHLSLEQALREERLFVEGSPSHAANAFDALSIYLRGAVRCTSFPALLADFRSTASREHQPWH